MKDDLTNSTYKEYNMNLLKILIMHKKRENEEKNKQKNFINDKKNGEEEFPLDNVENDSFNHFKVIIILVIK